MISLRDLPKVELHRHLEGSVRYATLKEIAREAGIPIPKRNQVQVGKNDPRTLRSFLKKFDPLHNLYPSRDAIERVAREATEDAARDGILHLELRFSPVHFARRMKADPVEVAGWIIRAARLGAGVMTVKFIVTLGRHHSPRENAPSVDAAIEHRGDVVALDVAGPEHLPLAPFAPLIKRGTRKGLGLTIHAGEARGPESVREALALGATRLGHGVRAARDAKLLEEIQARGIAFEMCLTSNVQTGAVRSVDRHPLIQLLRAGQVVTLNTDDPQVCGTNLVREFDEARRLGLDGIAIGLLQVHAIGAAFLGKSDRAKLKERIAWGLALIG
ncbi:MAG TPA: adenosine deaminase [Planctomycetota bacterium]|nr:adenosine deaminase [Planctomycetota bacterium]